MKADWATFFGHRDQKRDKEIIWLNGETDSKALGYRLEELKKLKAELLRARLRGEVNQADYDDDIDAIAQELYAVRSQRRTLEAFVQFAELMLVDVPAAWQRADAEQAASCSKLSIPRWYRIPPRPEVFEHH